MAKYDKKQFAEKYGKPVNTVTQNIKRGNIVLDSNGLIDISDIQNQKIIERWSKSLAKAAPAPQKKTKAKREPIRTTAEIEEQSKLRQQTIEENELKLVGMRADAKYKEARARKSQLEEDMFLAKYVQTKFVKELISSLSDSIMTQYRNSSEAFIDEFVQETKASREIELSFKAKFVEGLNIAHQNAVLKTKKDLSNYVKELKLQPKTSLKS